MAQRYELRNFVRYLSHNLLRDYFSSRNYSFPLEVLNDKTKAEEIEQFINTLEPKIIEKINLDFASINELSTEEGILILVDYLKTQNIELQAEIQDLDNYQCQAFYAFSNYPIFFDEASILFYVKDLPYKERTGIRKLQLDEEMLRNKVVDLEHSLQSYLVAKDGRGKNCKVEIYQYPDRICFLAYPEDYTKTVFIYNEKQELSKITNKSVFEIVYLYYPEEGKLELNCKFRGERINDLMKIFGEVVLEDLTGFDNYLNTYELNKILSSDFTLFYEPTDKIEYIQLKQLRLVQNKGGNKRRVTLETDEKSEDGMLPMKKLVEERHINPSDWLVNQTRIKFKFEGKGNKGSVTAELTFPDSCNLKDTSENQRKAKDYLSRWGLITKHE